jgi:3-oxoacyl-[acyl-carrier protein] reductase
MSRFDLSGRTAFVTGGSRGIGRAIAIGLAEAGAHVALTYRERGDDAVDVCGDIVTRGRRAIALQMEVTERESIISAAQQANAALGPISILVNNAGMNKPADFDKITDADWDLVLATNLKGPFMCAQLLLPTLSQSGSGSVVNISSVSGQFGGPRTAHYAASKAGLISLGQVIARFGAAYGVRSNTVAAGMVETELGSAASSAPSVQRALESILLKRWGAAHEIADAVVFLASDAASYITGQTINVNGGMYF